MQSTKVDHHKPTGNCFAVKALPKSADMEIEAIPVSVGCLGMAFAA
jgi:enamine deaminase RidA (YjgF/YER057c/UK114 family)